MGMGDDGDCGSGMSANVERPDSLLTASSFLPSKYAAGERPLLWIVGVLSFVRLIWSYLVPAFTTIATDFPNYYASAWALRHGGPMDLLYDPLWFQSVTERAGIHGLAVFFDTFTP